MATVDTTFSSFMKENVDITETKNVQVSTRFAEPFRIRAVTAAENDDITNKCTIRKRDKKGRIEENIDSVRYARCLTAAGVEYPNLNNAALQDSYGVRTAEDLLAAMLNAGEMKTLQSEVLQLSGFDVSFADEVEAAKN